MSDNFKTLPFLSRFNESVGLIQFIIWHRLLKHIRGKRFKVKLYNCQSGINPEWITRHFSKNYGKTCNYAYKLAKLGREDDFYIVVDEHKRVLRIYQGESD